MKYNDKVCIEDELCVDLLRSRLSVYIPYVRRRWNEIETTAITQTMVELRYSKEQPPGLYQKLLPTGSLNGVKGIQAFPCVLTSALKLTGVQGGGQRMVRRLCIGGFLVGDFICVELAKQGGTSNLGQMIAFVPAAVYADRSNLGLWFYITRLELTNLVLGHVPSSFKDKLAART